MDYALPNRTDLISTARNLYILGKWVLFVNILAFSSRLTNARRTSNVTLRCFLSIHGWTLSRSEWLPQSCCQHKLGGHIHCQQIRAFLCFNLISGHSKYFMTHTRTHTVYRNVTRHKTMLQSILVLFQWFFCRNRSVLMVKLLETQRKLCYFCVWYLCCRFLRLGVLVGLVGAQNQEFNTSLWWFCSEKNELSSKQRSNTIFIIVCRTPKALWTQKLFESHPGHCHITAASQSSAWHLMEKSLSVWTVKQAHRASLSNTGAARVDSTGNESMIFSSDYIFNLYCLGSAQTRCLSATANGLSFCRHIFFC